MTGRSLYWKQEENNRKWRIMPDTPKARASAVRQGAMFCTWTSLSEPYKGDGHPEPFRYGDLPLDFDSKDDPGQTLKDLKAICLVYLPELYELDSYSIQFFLSGGKGFHAVIPAKLFNAQGGDPYLPLIYKKIVSDWKERFDLKTLDMSLYCMGMGKMFRVANVKRNNRQYKVPLSLEEVRDLSYKDLSKMGAAAREIDLVDVDLAPNSYLEGLFKKCREGVYENLEKQKTAPPVKRSPLPKKIPDCINYILTEGPKTKSTTNLLILNLATFFQAVGASYDEALNQMGSFLTNYPHSTGYTTPQARIQHFKDQWQYIEKTPKYKNFRCEYILGLGLPGSAFKCKECALNRQEIGMEITAETPKPKIDTTKKSTTSSFPYEVMTGAAGYFADTYCDYIEAPPQFLFIAYLACLGAVISPRLRLRSVLDTQARIFAVLLGESATERKSTTLNICAKHFKSVVEDFNICWGVGSAEGLQKVFNRKTKHDNKPMGTLLTYDELKAFVSKCNIDSSVLLPIVNTLFEGNLYETHTKKQDINIDDAYLSMMAATTINTYNRIYNAAFLDIGFPNRIFLVTGTAERKHSIPKKIPDSENAHMKKHLIEVLQHVGESLELDVTPEAKEIYHNWYMRLEQTIHAKRLDTYSLRFMMLLAVNNLKHEIDADTVNDAIALCNWQLEVRKMYDPIDAEGKTAQMEESIRRVLKREPLKDYQLKQATGANRAGLWVFESAKKNLERSGEIAWSKKDKKWFYIEPQ